MLHMIYTEFKLHLDFVESRCLNGGDAYPFIDCRMLPQ